MFKIIKRIINHPEIIMYRLCKMGVTKWMSDEKYVSCVYKLAFKKKLNLKKPQAFSEKLNWYKLNYKDPLMHKCVDKYEVREFVIDRIGKKYLNDVYDIWDNIDNISIEKLPNKFVLKPTNGTGDIVICNDKETFDMKNAKKKLKMYENNHFSKFTKEWAYYGLPYRIMAEKYLENEETGDLIDYKFFCINGKPELLLVCTDRNTKLKKTWYNIDFEKLNIHESEYEASKFIKKPKNYKEMLIISEKLAKGFPFARIDLYNINGKIYFGEITFYPSGGIERIEPYEYDLNLGKKWNIEQIKK